MAGNLLFRTSLAAAVAREIESKGREGLAYKAEFERQGSDSLKHVAAANRDAEIMTEMTRARRQPA